MIDSHFVPKLKPQKIRGYDQDPISCNPKFTFYHTVWQKIVTLKEGPALPNKTEHEAHV